MEPKKTSTLRTRAITGFIFVLVVLGLVFYHKLTATLLLGLIAIMCSIEYTNMVQEKLRGPKFNLTVAAGILPFALGFAKPEYIQSYTEVILLSSIIVMSILAFLNLILNVRTNHRLFGYLIIFFYIGLALLGVQRVLIFDNDYNPIFLLAILVSMWASDTGAYLIGRVIGRTALHKRVSPNKTIEGWLGGGLTAALAGYIFSIYRDDFSMQQWIILMLVGWFFGSIGDLYESSIKRQLQVKDSGTILPGHGGFLDRFDSFIFAAPIMSYLIYFVFLK